MRVADLTRGIGVDFQQLIEGFADDLGDAQPRSDKSHFELGEGLSPHVKSRIRPPARSTSNKYFLDSSRIQQRVCRFDTAEKIWISDGGYRYQVDRFLEQHSERVKEPEVRFGIVAGLHSLELDEKVQIAGHAVTLNLRRRAEELEPANTKLRKSSSS